MIPRIRALVMTGLLAMGGSLAAQSRDSPVGPAALLDSSDAGSSPRAAEPR